MQVRLSIKGIVQGVFFRANTKQKADQLGLAGWVKNEPDGSVSILAQGPEEAIDQLIQWCQHGPPEAKVDHVEVLEKKKDIALSDAVFKIEH